VKVEQKDLKYHIKLKLKRFFLGKKTFAKNPSIQIQNNILSCEETVKLLGIDIDYQLKFDQHISNLCRKASQQLNVLKRLGSYLTKLNKLTIFHTFILSNLNFCPLAWHFCTDKNSEKLEKIQERALRFVYDDYSSSSETLLENAKESISIPNSFTVSSHDSILF
jgi:hypothetical protein